MPIFSLKNLDNINDENKTDNYIKNKTKFTQKQTRETKLQPTLP